MRIYLTHCSAKKDNNLRETGISTTPDKLYTAPEIQAFMQYCLDKGVEWAILSDRYGVWLPTVKHEWYEKHPDTVTEQEFRKVVENFDQTLRSYLGNLFFGSTRNLPSFLSASSDKDGFGRTSEAN